MPAEKNPSATDAPATAAERIEERLDHLEALAMALCAEIDLLRAERAQWGAGETDAKGAAEERPDRTSTEELRAVARGERTDAGLARVAALELVAEGVDRDTVIAELKRLGMEDPEPIVSEVFRVGHPADEPG
jgi:hypothetical protein